MSQKIKYRFQSPDKKPLKGPRMGIVSINGFCEQCGDVDIDICDEGTSWCEMCWDCQEYDDIPDEILAQAYVALAKWYEVEAKKKQKEAKELLKKVERMKRNVKT